MAFLLINPGKKYSRINKNIYGHFAEHLGLGIYKGVYVGEDSNIPNVDGIRLDVVDALKKIKAPVIRWPGGSFSEKYHWMSAIGPKKDRLPIVNSSWGGVVEDNSFGTHEFFKLCELTGADPYIAANITSGSIRELEDWVDYITNDGNSAMGKLRRANGREEPWELPFVGIGNENWSMRPEFYSDRFKVYASGMHGSRTLGIKRVACGPNGADYEWTDTLMKMTSSFVMNGLSLHYYTMPGYYKTDEWPEEKKGQALEFDRAEYYRTLRRAIFMDDLIEHHSAIMDKYDPQKRTGLVVDEWGTWYLTEPGTNPSFLYQQNTMRDAVVAGLTLNIFNKHSDRVTMANIAQMVNVLQAVILTKDEKMLLTPTYHVFDLYKAHQNATLIESYVQQDTAGTEEAQVPALSVSASVDDEGVVHATVTNLDADDSKLLRCQLAGGSFTSAKVRYVSGDMHDYNDFDNEKVVIKEMPEIKIEGDFFSLELPACSVAEITLK